MSNSVSGPVFSTSVLGFYEETFIVSEKGRSLTGIPRYVFKFKKINKFLPTLYFG